jgi:hypothetical protein
LDEVGWGGELLLIVIACFFLVDAWSGCTGDFCGPFLTATTDFHLLLDFKGPCPDVALTLLEVWGRIVSQTGWLLGGCIWDAGIQVASTGTLFYGTDPFLSEILFQLQTGPLRVQAVDLLYAVTPLGYLPRSPLVADRPNALRDRVILPLVDWARTSWNKS